MNRKEYANFELAFANGLDGLTHPSSGACSGCRECRETLGYDKAMEEFNYPAEPSFSRSRCNVCNSMEAGDRSPIHAFHPRFNTIIHLEACDDCVYYLDHGRLDDVTMAAIAAEAVTP